MIRVCFSMLLLMMLLSACASENPKSTVKETTPATTGKNILACTGLPIAGQKCGLEFPKI
jgi:PBP1b-binding outer membrane lipoprotein LpoB